MVWPQLRGLHEDRALESAVSSTYTMKCGDGDVLAKCRHLANRGISLKFFGRYNYGNGVSELSSR